MLSTNRDFHFIGELNIKKSSSIQSYTQPKDDKTNWLFLKIENKEFSFIYEIKDPLNAQYNKPFVIELSFLLFEEVKKIIKINHNYKVLRAEEFIGSVKIVNVLK